MQSLVRQIVDFVSVYLHIQYSSIDSSCQSEIIRESLFPRVPLSSRALFFFAAVVFTLFTFALASLTHLGEGERERKGGERIFARRNLAVLAMGQFQLLKNCESVFLAVYPKRMV